MRCFFVAIVTAALAMPAFAQDGIGTPREVPGQGAWEVTVSGTGSNDRKFEDGSFEVTLDIGQYVTPEILLALRQGVTYTSLVPGDQVTGNTRIAADYHFDLGNFQPFVGANIGYLYGDRVRDTWAAGPEAGIKYYLQDNAFLFFRTEYQFFFRSGRDLDGRFKDGNFIYTLGAGLNF